MVPALAPKNFPKKAVQKKAALDAHWRLSHPRALGANLLCEAHFDPCCVGHRCPLGTATRYLQRKTLSEKRGLKNLHKQIERTLGLTKLS
ncbi:hypothetical protein SAMN05443551_0279 [Marivita hallyeonensis]|uniref:Uncharacterized protein n=1 Tax=Marivita hallyeonensis TaxID=996342 RepID=A0A1M5LTY0_9RHOB|nr:hypothetical protein SAMN05443551_0279 [Marivita hallyeonensis]